MPIRRGRRIITRQYKLAVLVGGMHRVYQNETGRVEYPHGRDCQ